MKHADYKAAPDTATSPNPITHLFTRGCLKESTSLDFEVLGRVSSPKQQRCYRTSIQAEFSYTKADATNKGIEIDTYSQVHELAFLEKADIAH